MTITIATPTAAGPRWPALFDWGFRTFFLAASLWAALAMALWIGLLAGWLALPIAFDPPAWHAHEFLFGYLSAVIAGFLLTAVPNWTGRPRLRGWPLMALAALWLSGRVAVLVAAGLPALLVALIDLAMPLALAAFIAREIIAGGNHRNLAVVAILGLFIAGNGLFHWQAAAGLTASGHGLRLGLGAAVMLIAFIGGRIIPAFTRNWLVTAKAGGAMPAAPMQRFDLIALAGLGAGLLAWIVAPEGLPTAMLLALAGGLQFARLARWQGLRTTAEPLLFVLHIAYGFVPLGAIALAAEAASPGLIGGRAALHLWMAGAIGLMTLAVMSRATLGHSNLPLHAGPGTVMLYAALLVAVLTRLGGGLWPDIGMPLYQLAGAAWIIAFLGFALGYGRLFLGQTKAAD
ncbi:MAG: NnrS family protein [Sandarakinorhabdus sp.]|jgi:uncharacterized protein involved in response to NO|nr:NnrS family protein [Sandarakinorhabdus sp.]